MNSAINKIKTKLFHMFWNSFDKSILELSTNGIIIGVSGGHDSRVLLEILSKYPNRIYGKYLVVTINHKTRLESNYECDFIVNKAKSLGFKAKKIDIFINNNKIKNESFLRNERYRQLWWIARRYKYKSICTAHIKDDNTESYLMHLLGWGGGKIGASMPILRRFKHGFLIRPLLLFTRKDILSFLTIFKITNYFNDPGNIKLLNQRSIIRNKLIPYLNNFNFKIQKRLNNLSITALYLKDYFNEINYKTLIIRNKNKIIILINLNFSNFILRELLLYSLESLSVINDIRIYNKIVTIIIENINNIYNFKIINQNLFSFFINFNDNKIIYAANNIYIIIKRDSIVLERKQ